MDSLEMNIWATGIFVTGRLSTEIANYRNVLLPKTSSY